MSKLPAEILKEKYVPLKLIEDYVEGITKDEVYKMVKSGQIRYAEMRYEGSRFRIPHVNYEEINCVLRGEVYELHCSD